AARVRANADQGRIELEFDASPDEVDVDADQGNVMIVLPDEPGVAYATDPRADQGSISEAIRQDPSARRSITVDADQGDITITYASRRPTGWRPPAPRGGPPPAGPPAP